MFTVVIAEKGGKKQRLAFSQASVTVGRTAENEVVLTRGNVSKEHCRITHRAGTFEIEDMGSTNGTYVNGRKISGATLVTADDKIYVGEFILGVEAADSDDETITTPEQPSPPRPVSRIQPPSPRPVTKHISSPPPRPPRESEPQSAVAVPVPLPKLPRPGQAGPLQVEIPRSGSLHLEHLLDFAALEIKRIDRANLPCVLDEGSTGRLRIVLQSLIDDLRIKGTLEPQEDTRPLFADAFFAIVDLGPLTGWLENEQVSAIRINGFNDVQLRVSGSWVTPTEKFESPERMAAILKCLGSGLRGGGEAGIADFDRFVLENGAVASVQFPPLSLHPSACICLVSPSHFEDVPSEVMAVIQQSIDQTLRIAICGPSSCDRLAVTAGILAMLPSGSRSVAVEDTPMLPPQTGRIDLTPPGNDRTGPGQGRIRPLLGRAVDLCPDWIAIRTVSWNDIPEIIALSSSRGGVIAEMPLGGHQSMDRELSGGLLACGMAVSASQCAEIIGGAFDVVILCGQAIDGQVNILQVQQISRSMNGWMPQVLFRRK